MFDRPKSDDTAVLVSLDFGKINDDESLAELNRLAESANIKVMGIIKGKRSRPDPALFAGSGKVSEISLTLKQSGAAMVIFNHDLTAAQQRNLEKHLESRVIDRTSLILDIFAQRAQSYEGKLQVELAQLEHLATRLVRGWTHLERQKGGIGLRGPGETQLETDRRLIGKRVKVLKEKLERIRHQRDVQRRSRYRANVLAVSIVGYTNAGKSTLFNKLTHAQAYAADQLFATLDTTSRKLFMPEGGSVVISDTVGFIDQLPHTLIAAFSATLEEAVQADMLLHVVDANSPTHAEQIEQVNQVLLEIGATAPQILVLNKIDCKGMLPSLERDEYGRIARIWVSAVTGEGMDLIRLALAEAIEHTPRLAHKTAELS